LDLNRASKSEIIRQSDRIELSALNPFQGFFPSSHRSENPPLYSPRRVSLLASKYIPSIGASNRTYVRAHTRLRPPMHRTRSNSIDTLLSGGSDGLRLSEYRLRLGPLVKRGGSSASRRAIENLSDLRPAILAELTPFR